MRWAVLFGAALVAGCVSTVAPTTPAQELYGLESGLTTAVTLANQYAALPQCLAGSTSPCSTHTLVVQINAAAQTAGTAVLAAQTAVTSGQSPQAQQAALTQATTAVQTLTNLTARVKVK